MIGLKCFLPRTRDGINQNRTGQNGVIAESIILQPFVRWQALDNQLTMLPIHITASKQIIRCAIFHGTCRAGCVHPMWYFADPQNAQYWIDPESADSCWWHVDWYSIEWLMLETTVKKLISFQKLNRGVRKVCFRTWHRSCALVLMLDYMSFIFDTLTMSSGGLRPVWCC